MRAIVTAGHGGRDQLRYVEDRTAPDPGPGEVIVKVAYTAVNYHDIFTRRGMPGIKIPLPIIVGSDLAGEVARCGEGVEGWPPGTRVLVDPFCRSLGRIGLVGEVIDGGRADYVRIAADQLIAVAPGVELRDAACLPLAYGTARRMLGKRPIKAGETVLVLGASGGVGVACVQLAKLAGARVIACASSPGKVAALEALGVDHVVNYAATSFLEAVKDICGKPRAFGAGGVDVAVNFTGGDTWIDTQKAVRHGGTILSCGSTAGFEVAMDMRYLWTFEQSYLGSSGWGRSDLEALLALVEAGQLAPVVGAVLPLAEAAEAERMLEDREAFGKILLEL